MSQNMQNRFCQWEAAERRRIELESRDAIPRYVTADALGYWRVKIDRTKLAIIRAIQAEYRAKNRGAK